MRGNPNLFWRVLVSRPIFFLEDWLPAISGYRPGSSTMKLLGPIEAKTNPHRRAWYKNNAEKCCWATRWLITIIVITGAGNVWDESALLPYIGGIQQDGRGGDIGHTSDDSQSHIDLLRNSSYHINQHYSGHTNSRTLAYSK